MRLTGLDDLQVIHDAPPAVAHLQHKQVLCTCFNVFYFMMNWPCAGPLEGGRVSRCGPLLVPRQRPEQAAAYSQLISVRKATRPLYGIQMTFSLSSGGMCEPRGLGVVHASMAHCSSKLRYICSSFRCASERLSIIPCIYRGTPKGFIGVQGVWFMVTAARHTLISAISACGITSLQPSSALGGLNTKKIPPETVMDRILSS
jgi:hypothetical protein